MAESIHPPEDVGDKPDSLAAELALGVLDGDERAAARRRALADPAFAGEVATWHARFAPLHEGFGEAQPSASVWPAIARRLAPEAAPATLPVVPANDNGAGFWRWGALGSTAVAAALAAVLVLRPLPEPQTIEVVRAPDQSAVAQLGTGDGPALLAASYDAAAGELRIRAITLPDSRLSPELWVIPSDGVPRSLGLVAAVGTSRVAVSPEYRALMADGASLAISLEPIEGAPHKAPSSTPIAVGKIAII